MGLGPLAYSTLLAEGGFWLSPQTWLNDSWPFELVHHPKPFTMLIGTKLLAKVRELSDVSKSDLVRSAGYVSTKKDGMERLNLTAFCGVLLEAKGMHFGTCSSDSKGKPGRTSAIPPRSSSTAS